MTFFDRFDERLFQPYHDTGKCDFVGTALALGLGIAGAASSIGGAAIAAHGAGKAAGAQTAAANQAALLEKQSADQALQFSKQQYADQQQNMAPWLKAGQGGISQLSYLLGVGPESGIPTGIAPPISTNDPLSGLGGRDFQSLVGSGNPSISPNQQTTQAWRQQGIPFQTITTSDGRSVAVRTDQPGAAGGSPAAKGTLALGTGDAAPGTSSINPALGGYGSLSQGWSGGSFQAPTNVTEQNDPGFQFRLKEGQQALERSAAARGGLLSGGTAKALTQYGQDYGSNEYANVYGRALGEYQQRYNQFKNTQADQYNRLAALSGTGQVAASQLSSAGQQTAGNVGNILMSSAQQQGNALQNAGAATASGYAGGANAWSGGLSGGVNSLSNLLLLSQLGRAKGSPSSGYVYQPG